MICINLKSYSANVGVGAHSVLSSVRDLLDKMPHFKDKCAFCPNSFQLEALRREFPDFTLISQYCDAVELGKTTGKLPAEILKLIGVEYSLLNHSENRVYDEKLLSKIEFIQSKGVKLIVCCENIEEAKYIMESKPYAIAYEPPELIGSDISVSTQKPDIVKDFVNTVKDYSLPFIGAGITSAKDIEIGTKLGAKGYIIAKAFLDAQNKAEKLREFIEASI